MYLSLLAILAVPLFWSPLATHRLFAEVLAWQRTQIAVDNAAIRLGRLDREWTEFMERGRRRLEHLEKLHHPLHLCARVPQTMAACRSQDEAIERLLTATARWWEAEAARRWGVAPGRALEEGRRLGIPLRLAGRPPLPPVRRTPCPLCRLKVRWKWQRRPWRTSVGAGRDGSFTVILESSLESAGGYRLREGAP